MATPPSTRMTVKGTAFLARRFLLEQEFGAQFGMERAQQMFDEAAAAVTSLPHPILASTPIPMKAYLEFQDELVKRYYQNDPTAFFRFGERSAEWSLTQGPYKRIVEDKDIALFATQGEVLFRNFYDVGSAHTSLVDGVIEFHIEGVPVPYRHLFLEYATLGYFRRALEMLGGRNVRLKRLRGFSLYDADVYYQITFDSSGVAVAFAYEVKKYAASRNAPFIFEPCVPYSKTCASW